VACHLTNDGIGHSLNEKHRGCEVSEVASEEKERKAYLDWLWLRAQNLHEWRKDYS
jgi:hypothetical protein